MLGLHTAKKYNISTESAQWKEVVMTDLENMDELEADYGPPAPYAEHRIGERVTYQQKDHRFTGTIVYVAAPRVIAGKQIPTTYVIVRDHYEGMPDEVWPGDILQTG